MTIKVEIWVKAWTLCRHKDGCKWITFFFCSHPNYASIRMCVPRCAVLFIGWCNGSSSRHFVPIDCLQLMKNKWRKSIIGLTLAGFRNDWEVGPVIWGIKCNSWMSNGGFLHIKCSLLCRNFFLSFLLVLS